MKMKPIIIFLKVLILCFLPMVVKSQEASAYLDVSYYVIAHQDDWQLFMGTNVANDILSGEKVVIIHITAGDVDSSNAPFGVDLCTFNPYQFANRTVPYYATREQGAINSVHLITENSAFGNVFDPYPDDHIVEVLHHPMRRYEYRNTVTYFMRVEDREENEMADNHSLSALNIDSTTNYKNWCDLISTLGEIILTERVNENTGWLNIPDIDPTLNPNDHVSHINAGLAALYAVHEYIHEVYPVALFVDYDTQNRPANLGVFDAANEAGMAAAYSIMNNLYRLGSLWIGDDNLFQLWTTRNYYRVVQSDEIDIKYDPCTW